MGEISEVERARRRLAQSSKSAMNETKAQSFRLGAVHCDRLRKISQRSDLSQADVIRKLIDKEWDNLNEQRKRRLNKSA